MGNTATIDVEELRVRMYIHLDVGWMSHPFPLSSFRISDADQPRQRVSYFFDHVEPPPRDQTLDA